MPNHSNYYPTTIDGRAHWWQVIHDTAPAVLALLDYLPANLMPIVNDATWGIYCYGTIHRFFADVNKALGQYENEILDTPDGTAMPAAIVIPELPPAPAAVILAGIEARRSRWVQEVKNNKKYTASLGAQIGIETPVTPFNPVTYVCNLFEVVSRSPHTVSGKFRKAGGHADGINLSGRKVGSAAWIPLGRFTATPFTAQVPLSGSAPEEWEFMAMAVRRDVEFGRPSPVSIVIVRA